MKSVFEGQVLQTADIDHDLLQVKGEKTTSLRRTRFLVVPAFGDSRRENLLVLNYYKNQKIGDERREGILRYRELSGLPIFTNSLVLSEVFIVKRPLTFRETSEGDQRYLMVKPNVDGEYDVTTDNGTLIKDGPGYRVFGTGPYLFRRKDILYRFGHLPQT